jgi:hypothetical protein
MLSLTLVLVLVRLDGRAGEPVLANPTIAAGAFNPSLGETSRLRFRAERAGEVRTSIVDRDAFVIRRLPLTTVTVGKNIVVWDGRDDSGAVVPDDVYTFRLEFSDGKVTETYDPAKGFVAEMEEGKATYSRANGILSYTLKRPSRVHIQAGEAVIDKKTGKAEGPVLKTIVDHLPRSGGPVTEVWNGFDESGTIYIPDLPHFVVGIMATSLPENAVITYGNRKETFAQYAARTRPAAALKPRSFPAVSKEYRSHHQGLTALEDHSPKLEIGLPGAGAKGSPFKWKAGEDLALTVRLGEGSEYFLTQPTGLTVFLDGREVFDVSLPTHPAQVVLKTGEWPACEHRLAVNWGSQLGPVAVNAIKITVVK